MVAPRLLPLTVVAMAALLATKSAGLVWAASGEGSALPEPESASPLPPHGAEGGTPPVSPAPIPATMRPPLASASAVPASKEGERAQDPPGEAERTILLDLRRRRAALDAREQGLLAREAVAGATERRLAARVGELSALQTKLEALEAARQERIEAGWRGLSRVYEAMRPRDAAVIFNDLDTQTLLGVVDHMKDSKVAGVIAAMQPDRARMLTAELARSRLRANAPPDLVAAPAQPQPALSPPTARGTQ